MPNVLSNNTTLSALVDYVQKFNPITHRDPHDYLAGLLGHTVQGTPTDVLVKYINDHYPSVTDLHQIAETLQQGTQRIPVKVCATLQCHNLVNTHNAVYSHTHHGYVCPHCAAPHVLTRDTRCFYVSSDQRIIPAYIGYAEDEGKFYAPDWFASANALSRLHPDYSVWHTEIGREVAWVTNEALQKSGWEWRVDASGSGFCPASASKTPM